LLYKNDFFSAGWSISYLLLTPFSKIHWVHQGNYLNILNSVSFMISAGYMVG
jgi:hypothetical protein